MKCGLILITVVNRILQIFEIRDCCHSLYSSKIKQKKKNNWKSREDVPQFPIAGDANANVDAITKVK